MYVIDVKCESTAKGTLNAMRLRIRASAPGRGLTLAHSDSYCYLHIVDSILAI